MRNLLFTLILLSAVSCKAQSPVFDVTMDMGIENPNGAYYKDLHNVLNPFEGTYVYTNGNTSFKIVLQKKEMSTVPNNRYYYDYLIGEYQYIENGIEKVNTLDRLNINFTDQRNHYIGGNLIITRGDVGCFDCELNEKALRGGLIDGASEHTADLIIRRIIVNNRPAIKIWIGWRTGTSIEGQPAPKRPSFMGTYYTLIKQ